MIFFFKCDWLNCFSVASKNNMFNSCNQWYWSPSTPTVVFILFDCGSLTRKAKADGFRFAEDWPYLDSFPSEQALVLIRC